MSWKFNPPPGWPEQPPGWRPPPGWTPDPSWPPPPEGWQFWVPDDTATTGGEEEATVAVPTSAAHDDPTAPVAPTAPTAQEATAVPPSGGPAETRVDPAVGAAAPPAGYPAGSAPAHGAAAPTAAPPAAAPPDAPAPGQAGQVGQADGARAQKAGWGVFVLMLVLFLVVGCAAGVAAGIVTG